MNVAVYRGNYGSQSLHFEYTIERTERLYE